MFSQTLQHLLDKPAEEERLVFLGISQRSGKGNSWLEVEAVAGALRAFASLHGIQPSQDTVQHYLSYDLCLPWEITLRLSYLCLQSGHRQLISCCAHPIMT